MAFQPEKVQAVLFDIDGTLSDTDDQMVARTARMLKPFFRSRERRQSAARWIVMEMESPGNFIYNMADRFDLDSFFIRTIQRISQRKKHKVKSYWMIPGTKEMLAACEGRFPLGIVSARDAHTTNAFLHQFSLENQFQVVVTSQTCRYTKPFPDPLLFAAEQLSIDPENCLMVGDTTVDMKAAKLAGMQAVGVLCGFGREKELLRAGADVILPSTADLLSLF